MPVLSSTRLETQKEDKPVTDTPSTDEQLGILRAFKEQISLKSADMSLH